MLMISKHFAESEFQTFESEVIFGVDSEGIMGTFTIIIPTVISRGAIEIEYFIEE